MAVAIVDLGTARTKVTVAESASDGNLRIDTTAIDVSLAEAAAGRAGTSPGDVLNDIRRRAESRYRDARVSRVVYIGAQAFRDPVTGAALQAAAYATLPNFTVITPDLEASLFYRAIEMEERVADFAALDIGGGSIQIAWGRTPSESVSGEVGTYALERNFQKDLNIAVAPGSADWLEMHSAVDGCISSAAAELASRELLVIGSNIMKSFFRAALSNSGICQGEDARFALPQLTALANLIGGKPYSESYFLFPENERFIHGADKLLLVAIAVMRRLSSRAALGTNSSVSRGLCRLMLDDDKQLHDLGIAASEISRTT